MDIQFMKDYYDLRYEETDGENYFVEETAYQEKQSVRKHYVCLFRYGRNHQAGSLFAGSL